MDEETDSVEKEEIEVEIEVQIEEELIEHEVEDHHLTMSASHAEKQVIGKQT